MVHAFLARLGWQPLPPPAPAAGQPLPRGPAACTPGPVVAVAIHGWVQRAGLHGDKCLVLQAKPCLSVCGSVAKGLTPACRWTAQPGTEHASGCVPPGAASSVSPPDTAPRRGVSGGGSVVQWVLQGGWSRTTWVGSGLHPRHHQGLLRVG